MLSPRYEVLGSLFGGNRTNHKHKHKRSAASASGTAISKDSPLCEYNAIVVNNDTSANEALRILRKSDTDCLVYQGHYGNALQLLSSIKRRYRDRNAKTSSSSFTATTVNEQWQLHRQRVREEAELQNRLLVQVQPDHSLDSTLTGTPRFVPPLLRTVLGSDTASASTNTISSTSSTEQAYLVPLKQILVWNGSEQYRQKGIFVPQLDNVIFPGNDVYPPTRQEYLELLPRLPSPSSLSSSLSPPDHKDSRSHHNRSSNRNNEVVVMDVGTGTGILAAILLHQNPEAFAICTDINPKAIACARDNLERLGFSDRVELHTTNLFATNTDNNHQVTNVDVLVCNPPWIPGTADTWLDRAVFDDDDSSMLYGFLDGAAAHLQKADSEAWLILSDLAELLQLRSRDELLQRIHDGGLEIVETKHAKAKATKPAPRSPKKRRRKEDRDPLPLVTAARQKETTNFYRLRKRQS